MNENVMNTVEEGMEMVQTDMVETCGRGVWLKRIGIGAAIVGAGFGLYKVGKIVWAKIKANREQVEIVEETTD